MRRVLGLALAFVLLLSLVVTAQAASVLLSQGKTTTASSIENDATTAASATDGNPATRWSSQFSDPQWIQVDLGGTARIDGIILSWEAAYASAFRIQTSGDGSSWSDIYSTATGTGGTQTLAVNGNGRHVRVLATTRATGWGYSLWEFQVFGELTTAPPTGTPISEFKQVTASSWEGGNAPAAALDGRTTTRWSSQFSDTQWIRVDLGGPAAINQVKLVWEGAYAKGYRIETSNDTTTWTPIHTTTNGTGGTETLNISGTGRYIRMLGTARATGYGYSLWEFQVFGTVDTTTTKPPLLSPPTKAPGNTGRFALTAPADGAMITTTRRPALSWNAMPGATRYQVWINVSREDYDFAASGNLIDLYTKVAELGGTNYTPTWDISDRWTYKWFVVASDGSASNIRQFSVYLPTPENVADGVSIVNGARDLNRNGAIEPYEDWRQPVETRVNDLLGRMTAEEKAYQMFYNAQAFPQAGWHFGPAEAQDLHNILLASSGTRLGIPFVSAGDTISGYKTTYPLQSALAAAKNYPLDYKLGDMQRREQLEVGTRGVLGPLAEVGTKVLYPRIQEGNGENAEVAAAQVRALVAGLQGGPELNPSSVLATVKHWPGEGAGGEALIVFDAVTIKYHMVPFRAAMEAGAVNIMPGYAGSSFLDPGGPGAGDSAKILAYLRQNLGFTGLITTDWLPSGSWIGAANAGSDVMGGADPGAAGFSIGSFVANVPAARINDAVRRVLRLKFQMGLFENPYGDPVNGPYRFHTPAYTALANQAARESMTLLKNNGVLPLRLNRGDNIVVAGPRAADSNACCVWTSYFHQEYGSLNILDAIKARASQAGVNVYQDTGPAPKLAVVAVGEASYTHGTNWVKEQPYLPPDQLSIIQNFQRQGIPVVVALVMPRPYVITEWHDLASAIVVTYRGGEEMGPALASLLFGDYTARGKLPWQLPRALGDVLRPGGSDIPADATEQWDLPYDLAATPAQRNEIRARIDAGQQPPSTYGNPLYPYGAGL
ncbi:discoidin domain-containing protein [Kibdelosporangium aridum]|uniref:discoidin domain-containing protein n=1 Tax=Kibdelosporangium aridum TaxID=2030 RepID=UPI000AEBF124